MQLPRTTILSALALLALPGLLAAHGAIYQPRPLAAGGQYKGPGDTVPSGPPTNLPSAPRPAGAPASQPAVPRPTGGAPAATAPAPAQPIAAGRTSSTGGELEPDLTEWTWWWEFNKEPFLDLKRQLRAGRVSSGSDGFFLGYGYRRDGARDGFGPTDSVLQDTVLPALLTALREHGATDVITGSLIALGRVGDDQDDAHRVELARAMQPKLSDPNQEVRETAAVALGILGNESSALLLGEVLLDSPEGREAVGGHAVSERTRAFAAYGLGLVGNQTANQDVRRYVVHVLTRALSEDSSGLPDVGVACVLALGRVPLAYAGEIPERKRGRPLPATASREAQAVFLLDVLGDRQRHRLVRSHAPAALGSLLSVDRQTVEPELREMVVEELVDRLRAKRDHDQVMQSCVIALGQIGDNDGDELDREIRRTLLQMDKIHADQQVRHLALIALARVGARNGPGEGDDVERDLDEIRSHLLRKLAHDGTSASRWAALALGILERERTALGHAPSVDVTDALVDALGAARAPLDVGAMAIACGILGQQQAEGTLLKQFATTAHETALGHLAVALGMIDARGALEPIRELLGESAFRPQLMRELAIALGLLGDRNVVGLLVERLQDTSSLAARAAIAQALGRIGDQSSIAPLVEFLEDRERPEGSRAFAAVALGIVGDHDDLPWNAALSVDANYTAATATMYDDQGLGVLNLL